MILSDIFTQKVLAAASDGLKKMDPTYGAFETSTGSSRSVVFEMMSYFIDLLPVLLGALAFFAILYSAVLYLTAMGDPSRMEAAKKNITWVAMGVIAIAVTLIIINIVVNIAGKAI